MKVPSVGNPCCLDLREFCLSEVIVYHVGIYRNATISGDGLSIVKEQEASIPKKLLVVLASEIAFILTTGLAAIECIANAIFACFMSPCMLSQERDWDWRWLSPDAVSRAKRAIITAGYAMSFAFYNLSPEKLDMSGLTEATLDSDSEFGGYGSDNLEKASPHSEEEMELSHCSGSSDSIETARGEHELAALTSASDREKSPNRLRKSSQSPPSSPVLPPKHKRLSKKPAPPLLPKPQRMDD